MNIEVEVKTTITFSLYEIFYLGREYEHEVIKGIHSDLVFNKLAKIVENNKECSYEGAREIVVKIVEGEL